MSDVLDVLDPFGRKTGTVLGKRVTGPLKGYRGLKYTPKGATINKAGELTVTLPMALRNNLPLVTGAMIQVKSNKYGDQGKFVVGEKSEVISDDGRWATFTCASQVEELRWPDVPGFVTLDREMLSSAFARLLLLQEETPWSVSMAAADDVQLFANKYQVDGGTVQQAVSSLAKGWFLGWRQGIADRTLEIGSFKKKTGIRLVEPSMRPVAMNREKIRPIRPNGISPQEDAAGIVNCVIGLGTGEGWAQVSLRDLYVADNETAIAGTTWFRSGAPDSGGQLTPWAGYDPDYPIYRRYRYDGGVDGYQYFLIDPTSIAQYRKRFVRLNTNIGVVSGEPLDLQAAAAAVYMLTVAKLKSFAAKHDSYTITCEGRGNNVGIGGDTVAVEYPTFGINGDYVVTDCSRAVDDGTGAYIDSFVVSNIGRVALDDDGVITGALEDIQAMRSAATVYPSRGSIWVDSPITAASPIAVPWDADAAILAVVEAVFTVNLYPVYSTVTGGQVAGHHHLTPIPALSIDASVPPTNEGPYNPGGQFGHGHGSTAFGSTQGAHTPTVPSGQLAHGHNDSITAGRTGGSVSDGSVAGLDQHGHSLPIFGHQGPASSHPTEQIWMNYSSRTLGNNSGAESSVDTGSQNFNTHHAHGDTITAARTGGSVSSNPGFGLTGNNYAGFYPAVDGSGTGWAPNTNFPGYANLRTVPQSVQTSDDVAPGFLPVYGKFEDPNGKASGVTVWVDGVQIKVASNPTGIYNTDFVIDLTPYLQGQTPRTILFKSATLGRLLIRCRPRFRESIYHVG